VSDVKETNGAESTDEEDDIEPSMIKIELQIS
jgi:hypothetical protein